MINRTGLQRLLQDRLRQFPVVALVGPRQAGKTTLARALVGSRRVTTFDLERPSDMAKLAEPELALGSLNGLVVIDEHDPVAIVSQLPHTQSVEQHDDRQLLESCDDEYEERQDQHQDRCR